MPVRSRYQTFQHDTMIVINKQENYKSNNLSERIGAAIIDYGLIFTITFLLIFVLGTPNDEGGYSLTGWAAWTPTLVWFILTIGFEQFLGGTLGNSIMSLKVYDDNGFRNSPDFLQSFKRHLLDPIDMFPFGIIGI